MVKYILPLICAVCMAGACALLFFPPCPETMSEQARAGAILGLGLAGLTAGAIGLLGGKGG
jgi:hypothetical protein